MLQSSSFECVLRAWQDHEHAILQFLISRTANLEAAEDLLQEVFLKSIRYGNQFCSLDNPKAWLYRVAKTTLIDYARIAKATTELSDDIPAMLLEERPPVDELDTCIARNLPFLNEEARIVIELCDLQGLTLRAFAEQEHISLPAAKSRLLRARQRLREILIHNCQVHFDEQGRVCCHMPKKE